MGTYAVTNGDVTVKNAPEVQGILESLRLAGESHDIFDLDVQDNGESLDLHIQFEGHMSYSSASDFDDTLRELSPYVISGGRFNSECDGEREVFYIGSDTQKAASVSADSRDEILRLLPTLTPEDFAEVAKRLVEAGNGKE